MNRFGECISLIDVCNLVRVIGYVRPTRTLHKTHAFTSTKIFPRRF